MDIISGDSHATHGRHDTDTLSAFLSVMDLFGRNFLQRRTNWTFTTLLLAERQPIIMSSRATQYARFLPIASSCKCSMLAIANASLPVLPKGPGSTIPVPAAQDQIDTYLAKSPASRDKDIFVLFIGANDAFFSENVTGLQIAGLVADQVAQLYESGTCSRNSKEGVLGRLI